MNIHENVLNINKTSFALTFITFTTQKPNKNKIRLFHILLIIFFLCPFSSITKSYKLFCWRSGFLAF